MSVLAAQLLCFIVIALFKVKTLFSKSSYYSRVFWLSLYVTYWLNEKLNKAGGEKRKKRIEKFKASMNDSSSLNLGIQTTLDVSKLTVWVNLKNLRVLITVYEGEAIHHLHQGNLGLQ